MISCTSKEGRFCILLNQVHHGRKRGILAGGLQSPNRGTSLNKVSAARDPKTQLMRLWIRQRVIQWILWCTQHQTPPRRCQWPWGKQPDRECEPYSAILLQPCAILLQRSVSLRQMFPNRFRSVWRNLWEERVSGIWTCVRIQVFIRSSPTNNICHRRCTPSDGNNSTNARLFANR